MASPRSRTLHLRPHSSTISIGLINDLKSLQKDDIRRRQKKRLLLKKMTDDPNSALRNLSAFSQDYPLLRSKCFTFLRKLIFMNEKDSKILLDVLLEVKPILLSCLEQVSVNQNPHKLCEVVSIVAFKLSEFKVGPWSGLLDYIGSSFNSDNEWTQELGLTMFGYLRVNILGQLQEHFDLIFSAVFRHLESIHGNLRKLARMAALNLVHLATSSLHVSRLQDLVPEMIVSINQSLNDFENSEIVLKGFENLTAVVAEQDTFHEENLNLMFESMMEIAENQNVTPLVQAKAFEAIKEIDELYPEEVSKALENLSPEVVDRCFLVWMDMLMLVDDVPNWHNVDDDKDVAEEIEGETESYRIGVHFLDRISFVLRDEIFPFAFENIQIYVAANQDWRKRLAGINTLSIISEACSKELMENYLESMISVALSLLEDQNFHPRLCYAALNCVKILCKDWAPTTQRKYHGWILPALVKLSCHPEHHRNQMQQAQAILYCCIKCTPENLEPFLSDIILKVQELCQSNSLVAQEWAVSALGIVAASAKDRFSQFYDTAMETLKGLLVRSYQESRYKLGAKCLSSISRIAMLVGKERFQNDASQVMEVLISILRSIDSHSPLRLIKIIIFQVLEDLCHCLGQESFSFLKDLMPVFLPSCKLVGEANNKGQIPQRSPNNSLQPEVKACKLLYFFANEFKEKFFPWIMEAANTLISMLDLDIVTVRMEAAPALPKLLEASTLAVQKGESEGNTMSYVENLVNLIIPALLQAFDKVVHKRLYATLYKSLSECAQISGPFIALDHITQITDRIQKGFSAYSLRKKVRVNEQKEQDPVKQNEEEQLLNEVSNCLVTMIQQYRANFLPNLGHENLKLLIKNLWDGDCTYKEKKILISIFRNVMHECQEDAHQYYDMYLPPLLISCMDDDLRVRQEAAMGINACAEFGTSKLKDIARGAMNFLPHIIRNLEELSVKNGNAYDIAVSVLKEVFFAHGPIYRLFTTQFKPSQKSYLPSPKPTKKESYLSAQRERVLERKK
ncbi:hypothetical protein UlMin_023789 [Ulmus minor]